MCQQSLAPNSKVHTPPSLHSRTRVCHPHCSYSARVTSEVRWDPSREDGNETENEKLFAGVHHPPLPPPHPRHALPHSSFIHPHPTPVTSPTPRPTIPFHRHPTPAAEWLIVASVGWMCITKPPPSHALSTTPTATRASGTGTSFRRSMAECPCAPSAPSFGSRTPPARAALPQQRCRQACAAT